MRFFFSLAVFVCSLLTTAFAVPREYGFGLSIANENTATIVCTDAELDDLANRVIPTILSVMADPKYDLKPTKESDWKIYKAQSAPINRKDRELQMSVAEQCDYCRRTGAYYLCIGLPCGFRRLLRSQRELSDIEVLEIRSNTEGAMRGLLNKFVNTSPYSKDCTKALIGATIKSSITIIG